MHAAACIRQAASIMRLIITSHQLPTVHQPLDHGSRLLILVPPPAGEEGLNERHNGQCKASEVCSMANLVIGVQSIGWLVMLHQQAL
jgi:hypothetical protein